MTKKSIIYYVLAVVSAIIAVIILFKSLDWRSLVILVFGVAAALFFRQGVLESKNNE